MARVVMILSAHFKTSHPLLVSRGYRRHGWIWAPGHLGHGLGCSPNVHLHLAASRDIWATPGG